MLPQISEEEVAAAQQAAASEEKGRAPWSAEEDATLIEGVRRHGCKWRVIVASLPGRSGSMARNRYNRLQREGIAAVERRLWSSEADAHQPPAPAEDKNDEEAMKKPTDDPTDECPILQCTILQSLEDQESALNGAGTSNTNSTDHESSPSCSTDLDDSDVLGTKDDPIDLDGFYVPKKPRRGKERM